MWATNGDSLKYPLRYGLNGNFDDESDNVTFIEAKTKFSDRLNNLA